MSDPTASVRERLDALRKAYAQGLPEKIEHIETLWTKLAKGRSDDDALRSLHFAVHSLAGSGATFGYSGVSKAAQALEDLFQSLTETGTPPTRDQKTQVRSLLEALGRASEAVNDVCEFGAQVMPPPSEDKGEKLIFLVEDDADQAQDLEIQIGHFGYRVKTIPSLADLETTIEEHHPSAIVMDMVFPEGELAGAKTIGRIRQSTDTECPIVFISARGDFEARLQAVRAGADAYFTKPVDVSELVDRLDVLTGRSIPEPYRILIVEDDPPMAAYYASVLQQADMATDVINDPLQVIDRIVEFSPDLILTDLYMPQCDGLDLAKVIRQQNAYAAIPIVFLSSETRVDKQLSALNLGGDDFLTKPVRTDKLIASVTSRAQRARTLQSLMVRDGLTGLLNHSRLKEQLVVEANRAKRDHSSLAFAMLDIDHFKSVNDTFGHPTGDRVLKSLAQVLSQRLRKTDIIGRYGGE